MEERKLIGVITPKKNLTGTIAIKKSVFDTDYENLINKPTIEGIELSGNKMFEDFGYQEASITDILNLFK